MPKELGTKVSESKELGDAVVITRTIGSDQVTTPKLLEWHDNVSCSSGGVAASVFKVFHNLSVAPVIYGATLLSHASGGNITVLIGGTSISSMDIVLRTDRSGMVAVSGLPVHAFVMI